MLEIIIIAVLLLSLAGAIAILFRKMPILANLREKSSSDQPFAYKIKKIITKFPKVGKIDYDLYLQKMLSKVRVMTFKVEGKTGNWLERLRQRRNGHNHDNDHNSAYWEELKKTKKGE